MLNLFTYGTLMKGCSNHRIIAGKAEFIGEAILKGYGGYRVTKYFPGIIKEPDREVVGELYAIDESLLPTLDALEGEGTLYIAKNEWVSLVGKEIMARVYVFNKSVSGVGSYNGKWSPR